MILLVTSILIRLPQYGTVQRNDGAVYYPILYSICRDFEFSIKYILKSFNLSKHLSYSYSLVCAIPEFLNPGDSDNVWIAHTVMALLAIYAVYDTLRHMMPDHDGMAAFGAFLFGCSPMFLGLTYYMQPDYGTAAFAIYVVWAYYRKRYWLLMVASLMLAGSKEFGIGVLAGFTVGVVLYQMCSMQQGNLWQRLFKALFEPRNRCLFLACLILGVLVLCYVFGSGQSLMSTNFFAGSDISIAGIEWNVDYIVYKVVQFFATNFTWLQTLIIIAILIRIHKDGVVSETTQEALRLIAGIAGAILLFGALSNIVVTYTIVRYDMPIMLLLTLAMVILLAQIPMTHLTRIGTMIVTGLLLVQAYFTIDPVMILTYPHMAYSYAPLVYTDRTNSGWIGDYAIYNYQNSYISNAIELAMKETDFDEDTNLMTWQWCTWAVPGLQGMDAWWDAENEQWSMNPDGENNIDLNVLWATPGDDLDVTLQKEKVLFIDYGFVTDKARAQYGDPDIVEYLSHDYTDIEQREASLFPLGKVVYYTARRK